MKIVRAQKGTSIFYGVLENDCIKRIDGTPFDGINLNGETYATSEVTLLAPAAPSKVVAIGKNYHAHAMEMQEGEPTEPLLFLKPSTSIIADNDDIVYPSISKRLDYEGELGVVIGKKCRRVSEKDAMDYVLGYTCLNDVTARDIQKGDSQWTRGKGFDTFCPIGPHIETDISPFDLIIQTRVNGTLKQNSRTSCMTHKIPKLIEYISRVMTLLPGDIIATGTPEGIGELHAGDIVEIELEGIGILRNRIISEE